METKPLPAPTEAGMKTVATGALLWMPVNKEQPPPASSR